MSNVQQWGRRESIIWPPRGLLYTFGAFFLALIATGVFVFLRFQFGLDPLARYYIPYYFRTETIGSFHPSGLYQLLVISDGKLRSHDELADEMFAGLPFSRRGTRIEAVLRGAIADCEATRQR